MKKVIAIFTALVLTLTLLAGCGQSATNSTNNASSAPSDNGAKNDKKISIVATIFPQYDFARAIIGDKAELTMLLPLGAESHSFEPTPQDIIRVQESDVFLFVGGHNDTWIYDLLETMDTSDKQVVEMIKCVDVGYERIVEGMAGNVPGEDAAAGHEGEGHEGEEHEAFVDENDTAYADENVTYHHHEDEHVWTSPVKSMELVKAITEAICQADPDNREYYESNRDAYLAELTEIDALYREITENPLRRTFVMGDRFPLRYLADEYGLTYYAAFPGCAQDTEVSAGTIAYMIDKVKEEELPIVFHMELSNMKIADAICESTGAEKRLLHSAHNLSKDDFEAGLTYLDIMRQNAVVLKEALN